MRVLYTVSTRLILTGFLTAGEQAKEQGRLLRKAAAPHQVTTLQQLCTQSSIHGNMTL